MDSLIKLVVGRYLSWAINTAERLPNETLQVGFILVAMIVGIVTAAITIIIALKIVLGTIRVTRAIFFGLGTLWRLRVWRTRAYKNREVVSSIDQALVDRRLTNLASAAKGWSARQNELREYYKADNARIVDQFNDAFLQWMFDRKSTEFYASHHLAKSLGFEVRDRSLEAYA